MPPNSVFSREKNEAFVVKSPVCSFGYFVFGTAIEIMEIALIFITLPVAEE